MTELHPAFVWDCERCGRENFFRAICGNLDEAAFRNFTVSDGHILVDFAAEPGAEFDEVGNAAPLYVVSRVALCPKTVRCKHCTYIEQTEIFVSEG